MNKNSKISETTLHNKHQEIYLIDIFNTIWSGKKFITLTTLITTLLGLIYALTATPIFTATTVIMPPQQQSAASSMLSALGGLGSGGGALGAALGLKNPNDIYVAILGSQSVKEGIAQEFQLQKVYGEKLKINVLKKISAATKITASKDGLIIISVEDTQAERAAKMANQYVVELKKVMGRMAISSASQRRLFFEKQLVDVKNALANAEIEMAHLQKKSGIIQLEAQGAASIQATTLLTSQITAKEAELSALKSSMSINNPQIQAIQSTLNSLKLELKKLSGGSGGDDMLLSKNKMTAGSIDYIRKMRDVKYNETLFELLAKQYEMAKLDEANEGAIIQVLDVAETPEQKTKPKKSVIVKLSFIVGLLFGVVGLFIKNYVTNLRKRILLNEPVA